MAKQNFQQPFLQSSVSHDHWNHSNMIIWCPRNILQCWKQLCYVIFFWKHRVLHTLPFLAYALQFIALLQKSFQHIHPTVIYWALSGQTQRSKHESSFRVHMLCKIYLSKSNSEEGEREEIRSLLEKPKRWKTRRGDFRRWESTRSAQRKVAEGRREKNHTTRRHQRDDKAKRTIKVLHIWWWRGRKNNW